MRSGELVREGWHITWNHKFLWVLGFVTASISFDYDNLTRANDLTQASGTVENVDATAFDSIASLGDGQLLILVLVGSVVLFAVVVLLWLLGLAARGGLYFAVAELDDGRQVGLKRALGGGARHLPRLAMLNFLLYLPVFAFIAMLLVIAIIEKTSFTGDLRPVMLPLFCIFLPYFVAILLVSPLAMRAVVLDGLGVSAAIRRGLWLVKDNLGAIIGVGLYFVLYGLPVGIMIFIAAAINLLLGAVVAVTLKTLLDAFQSTTFTLAYRAWTGYEAPLPVEELQPAPA